MPRRLAQPVRRHPIRANTRDTCAALHRPPRAVGTPCRFNPSARARIDTAPAVRNSTHRLRTRRRGATLLWLLRPRKTSRTAWKGCLTMDLAEFPRAGAPVLDGVTEADVRAALRCFVAVGGVERWIAAQPWQVVAGDWRVVGEHQGWRFRLAPAPDGVHVVMSRAGGEQPAVWFVPSRPAAAPT
jgi:hypothetical protein